MNKTYEVEEPEVGNDLIAALRRSKNDAVLRAAAYDAAVEIEELREEITRLRGAGKMTDAQVEAALVAFGWYEVEAHRRQPLLHGAAVERMRAALAATRPVGTDAQVEAAAKVFSAMSLPPTHDLIRAALAAAQAGATDNDFVTKVQNIIAGMPVNLHRQKLEDAIRALRPAETAESEVMQHSGEPGHQVRSQPNKTLALPASEPAGPSEEDVAHIIFNAGAMSGIAHNAARAVMALLRRRKE